MNKCRVCGDVIPPTGRKGRPATTCAKCKAAPKPPVTFPRPVSNADKARRDAAFAADVAASKADKAAQTPKSVPVAPESHPGTIDAMIAQAAEAAARHAVEAMDLVAGRVDLTEALLGDLAEQVAKVVDAGPALTTIVLPNRPEPIKLEGRQHAKFDKVLRAIALNRNVMLVGPAGSGKTFLCRSVAKAMDLPFHSVSVNEQTQWAHVIGYMDANSHYVRTPFREAWENGGVFLLDEADNGRANLLSGLNLALPQDVTEMSFPDGTVAKHANCVIMVATNTYGHGAQREYAGRNVMDGAFLNRFVRITLEVDEEIENTMVHRFLHDGPADRWLTAVRKMRRNVDEYNLKLIVSPRTAEDGAALLSDGWDTEEVLSAVLTGGLSSDMIGKLMRGVTL